MRKGRKGRKGRGGCVNAPPVDGHQALRLHSGCRSDRLLKILRYGPEYTVECLLEKFGLSEAPQYFPLSYTDEVSIRRFLYAHVMTLR
jgi:hypothetical protein